MARVTLSLPIMLLLLLLVSWLHILSVNSQCVVQGRGNCAAKTITPAAIFIRNSCRFTTYPNVCVQSLMNYAPSINRSSRELVMTALSVSVDRAQSTKSFVAKLNKFHGLKPKEKAALKDCFEEISESVDQLNRSVKELRTMGRNRGPEYLWHLSNLQTWVSAALTDDSTCSDGFSGQALNGRIKYSIRSRMANVAQVTSNALALCNKLGGN